MLDTLLLKGCLVTIDAMGYQKAIAAKIVARECDYALMVKNNQPSLAAAMEGFFDAAEQAGYQGVAHTHARWVEKGPRAHRDAALRRHRRPALPGAGSRGVGD